MTRQEKVGELLQKLTDRFTSPDFNQTDDFWQDWEKLDMTCAQYIKSGSPTWDDIDALAKSIYEKYQIRES